jgi:medium-chain acyl-[acyl-carrier-protein] hydrolase
MDGLPFTDAGKKAIDCNDAYTLRCAQEYRMQKNGIWQEGFRIRADEMDRRGRLSPLALFNYLQEAAGRHAEHLGVGVRQLLAQKQNWMLSRFFIQIHAYPRYGDKIAVHTWPRGTDRFFALRDFLVVDGKQEIIARASSCWLLINLEARRIMRLGTMLDKFSVNRRAVEKNLQKLPPPLIHEAQQEFRVRLSDIDVNQHANSVAYLEWMLETVPVSTQDSQVLTSLEVNFQAEARFDETVVSSIHVDDTVDGSWFHVIQKKKSGEELARARSTWKTHT